MAPIASPASQTVNNVTSLSDCWPIFIRKNNYCKLGTQYRKPQKMHKEGAVLRNVISTCSAMGIRVYWKVH